VLRRVGALGNSQLPDRLIAPRPAGLPDCQIARLPACQSRRLIFEEQRPHHSARVIRVDEKSWRAPDTPAVLRVVSRKLP